MSEAASAQRFRTRAAWIIAACGMASVIILVSVTAIGGSLYPGYDHMRHFMSELGATGAPTQGFINAGFIGAGMLLIPFWLGAAWLLPRSALLIVGAMFLTANAIGLGLAGVYPCDYQCVRDNPSFAAVLHDLFGGLGYLCALIGLPLLTIASRRWPLNRIIFPAGVICSAAAVYGFAGVVAESDLHGLDQRILETAMATFTVLVAAAVLHASAAQRPMK